VKVVKHVFPRHIVLHYIIINTLTEQVLRNVSVEIGSEEDHGFVVETVIPAPEASYDEASNVFAVISRPPVKTSESGMKIPTCNFWNNLLYKAHEIDSKTNQVEEEGFTDEFALDDVEILVADYIRPNYLPNFSSIWTQTDNDPQSVTTFSLSTVNCIKDGVVEMIRVLGMSPCENSEQVTDARTKHVLYLSGIFVEGNAPVIARVRMRYSQQQGAGMELAVRSPNTALAETLANIMFS